MGDEDLFKKYQEIENENNEQNKFDQSSQE